MTSTLPAIITDYLRAMDVANLVECNPLRNGLITNLAIVPALDPEG